MDFQSDCCQCYLIIHQQENNFVLDDWKRKCELHKNITDKSILNVVLTHNTSFNRKYGNAPDKTQRDEIKQNKRTEFKRIRNMGSGITK